MRYLLGLSLLIVVGWFAGCKGACEGEKGVGMGTATPAWGCVGTSFAPTLACYAPKNRNVVYTPVFLFAWDKLRDTLGAPVTLLSGDKATAQLAMYGIGVGDFNAINNATSYKGALSSDEYETQVIAVKDTITVRASFKQSLVFEPKMAKYYGTFEFGDSLVYAFGMPDYDSVIAQNIKVIYYKNDDTFIIKLSPTNKQHEIILAKGFNGTGATNLDEINNRVQHFTATGLEDMSNNKNAWKYLFKKNDCVVIPVLQFDLDADYTDLQLLHIAGARKEDGKVVSRDIIKAWQRTAFVLNEDGAKVEAQAEIIIKKSISIGPDEQEVPHKKTLVFDKPFTVLLHKTGQAHPYFMAKIENGELMVRGVRYDR